MESPLRYSITRILPLLLLPAIFLIGFQQLHVREVDRFTVPEGFVVEEVYSPEDAGSLVALTFDSYGRLVLSREDSFVVTLLDPDGDGTFEERVFTDRIEEAQGTVFDGPDLLAAAEGPYGGPDSTALYRVIDEDGDSRGDRLEVVEKAVGGMGDHGPHQPFFGPDGFLYWTLGNRSGTYSVVDPLSPFHGYEENTLALTRLDPRGHANEIRMPGGTFVRKNLLDPDSDWQQVVGGFRNQYDGAFNVIGELFTYDSDMEWDRNLPWFRETRSVHAVPGGDYGWRTGSRKHLDYYIDTLPPMEDVGRGSPTGVTVYQAYNYPAEYFDMVLQSDWSRGRIIMGKLTRNGATYSQDSSEDFVYGEPLNVVDVEVGPDGNVYFALGGRDTEGGVYRVVYTGPNRMTAPQADTPIERAITMPQHRSAYSRRMTREIKQEVGDTQWQEGLTAVVREMNAAPMRRARALELLHVYGPGLDVNLLTALRDDPSWEVRAASTYYLGTVSGQAVEDARRELVARLADSDPFVQRRAAEALIRTGINPAMDAPLSAVEDVFPLLANDDRFVRYAAKELLRRINLNDWRDEALALDGYPEAAFALAAYVQSVYHPSVKDIDLLVERERELLKAGPSDDDLISLIRVMQMTMVHDLGMEFEGGGRGDPGPGAYEEVASILLERFPTGRAELNREIARVFAHLKPEGSVGELAAELGNPEDSREQQIFYAYALSAIDVGWDDTTREQMISWFEQVRDEQWKGGASYVGYLSYMLEDFAALQPPDVQEMVEERVPQLTPQVAEGEDGPSFRGPEYEVWFSDEEIEESLIYNPSNFEGDPSEGAEAYEKAFCGTCHTFGPLGQEYGPDLTTVGQRFSRKDLVEAVLRPSETISDLWTVEEITTTDDQRVSGTIYREDASEVVVQIPGGAQVTIPKSDIASREVSSVSAMPEGLLNNLSRGEMGDLFLFLEAGPEAIPDTLLESR